MMKLGNKVENYPALSFALSDMEQQSELYRPSLFWKEAAEKITKDLCEQGIDNFRNMRMALSFFVPTYGTPGNCFSKEQVDEIIKTQTEQYPEKIKMQLMLKHLLSGESQALADYRVFLAGDDINKLPYLHSFSESSFGNPVEQFEFEGQKFSRSSLNYLQALCFLKKHLKTNEVPKTILEIGGGFGTLGEILASSGINDFKYINIDIPPISYISESYLSAIAGYQNVSNYRDTRDLEAIQISSLAKFSSLCSWQIEKLNGKIDLFVNFISFQEMEPDIVENYLKHVFRLEPQLILLRNLREGKAVKSEHNRYGVNTPTTSDKYDLMLENYHLIATNVHPFGKKTIDGFHSEFRLYRAK